MFSFKIETHCHTKEVSSCSQVPGKILAGLYKNAGYDAITVTDHFYSHWFNPQNGSDEEIERHYRGYYEAKDEGERIGLKVYHGVEFRFDGSQNDYLLYGADKVFLKKAIKLFTIDIHDFYNLIKAEEMAFYQAHPFRDGITRAPSDALDGIEIYNMHPDHNSHNETAIAYALEKGLPGLSGSDAHEERHVGRGGIISSYLPKDDKELAKLILSKDYKLIN
jgi:predicted metal-dependent phosphoesterase TrpH